MNAAVTAISATFTEPLPSTSPRAYLPLSGFELLSAELELLSDDALEELLSELAEDAELAELVESDELDELDELPELVELNELDELLLAGLMAFLFSSLSVE